MDIHGDPPTPRVALVRTCVAGQAQAKHHTSVLDHPLPDEWSREEKSFVRQPRLLHLKTARCLEEVVDLSASCGFLDAEGAATEHAPAVEYMHHGDTDGETSGASDYGTLA